MLLSHGLKAKLITTRGRDNDGSPYLLAVIHPNYPRGIDYVSSEPSQSEPMTQASADMRPLSKPHGQLNSSVRQALLPHIGDVTETSARRLFSAAPPQQRAS
jgi:hypothetical protein